MKLILANPRGFCAGVQMAVDVVSQTISLLPGEKVYVFHEIVHNRHVVNRFQQQGVVFVEDLAEVPQGSILVFSAHGVSPEVREYSRSRGFQTIDATCPLVTKVHSECIRYARQGYEILLVGHANHQEVVGTRGEAPEAVTVVESAEQVASLKVRDENKLVYLTQTTLSTDDAGVIIAALKARFPNLKEPPSSDICYATTNRQNAVRQIAPECDIVLVVGSKNSSNSVRLTEIAQNVGTAARLIDDVSEVDWSWFKGDETVMITAGASAPEDLVAALCRELLQRFGGELEQREIVNEDVEFGLPLSLRKLGKAKGVDLDDSRIRVGAPTITHATYGAVALTVSAKGK